MWRITGITEWLDFGRQLDCGEDDHLIVRIARKPKPCFECGEQIVRDVPYAEYWVTGCKHEHYCLQCSPVAVHIQAATARRPRAKAPATAAPNYWLTVWSQKTWREFLVAGGQVYGVSATYEKFIKKLKVGDQLICYRRGFGFSEFFAILEITSQPFWDNRPIWSDDIYPVRLNVRQVLAPRQPIKFTKVYKRLSLYQRLRDPHNHRCWSNHFHQALKSWTPKDARVVINSLNRQAAREQAGRAARVA